jgi:hypothetical protein
MAANCDAIRTELARQTPVYDENFLEDYVSEMLTSSPFMGRHQTRTWTDGKDTITYDKVSVQQPDYTGPWERINSAECGNACEPPMTTVGFGTTRDTAFMEQKDLISQPWCLQQLRGIPHVGEQIARIYRVLREFPQTFTDEFLRTRFLSYHDTLQIAGSGLSTFAVTSANTSTNLTTINLGSAANLPSSQLTLPLLEVYGNRILQNGYDRNSGMPAGTINLVTYDRVYQNLTMANPALRSQLYSQQFDNLSPLYKIGQGISAKPFGFIAPTFDRAQVRFQHSGNGLLQRVFPYINVTTTTGSKPVRNPAWDNARYALSYIIHQKAAVLYTPQPKKIHEMVPSVNTAMFGKWTFINNQGIIRLYYPDGTYCDKDNADQFWFYWRAHLELGFRYDQRELVMPILHLIDGFGEACLVDQPVCGTAPTYTAQDYSGAGTGWCEA